VPPNAVILTKAESFSMKPRRGATSLTNAQPNVAKR
jgi:hypothetical protein